MTVRARFAQALPDALVDALRPALSALSALLHAGSNVECPVCGGHFASFVALDPDRPFAQCPRCRVLERHRALWIFLQRRTDLFDGRVKSVLHIAPERFLQEKLQQEPGIQYLSGDLLAQHAMVKLDVTRLQFDDSSFDVIFCSHVLEHVDDDKAAMRELLRVLRPGGWAILDAPINPALEDTFEDWSVTTPEGRLRVFGQVDHVRVFGRDYPDLLRAEGWLVEVDALAWTDEEIRRHGLRPNIDHIYFCRKPA